MSDLTLITNDADTHLVVDLTPVTLTETDAHRLVVNTSPVTVTVSNSGGYNGPTIWTAFCVVGVTAVDGTATDLAIIFEDYHSGGTGNVPLHWRAITPASTNIPISALDGKTVIVPIGAHVGVYVVHDGAPWTRLDVKAGDPVYVTPIGNRNQSSVWFEGINTDGVGGGVLIGGNTDRFKSVGMDAAYVAMQSPEPGTDLYTIVETDGFTTVEELLTELDKIKPRRWTIKAGGAAFSLTAGQIDGADIGFGANVIFGADPRDFDVAAGLTTLTTVSNGDYVIVTADALGAGAPLGLYKVASPYWEHITTVHKGDVALVDDTSSAAFSRGGYFLYAGDGQQFGGWHYPMWGVYLSAMGSHAGVHPRATADYPTYAVPESENTWYGTFVYTGTSSSTHTLPSAGIYYGKTITVVNTSAAATITIQAKSGQSILNGVTTLHGTNYEVRQYRAITTSGWVEV